MRSSGDATSSSTQYEFAVDVTPAAGERFRAGMRQSLLHKDHVRLGQSVPVRHRDGGHPAIIDWPEMLRQWGLDGADVHEMGWKPLRRPPEDGIDDTTLPRLKGDRTTGTVLSATRLELPIGRVRELGHRPRLAAAGRSSRSASTSRSTPATSSSRG